MQSVLMPEKTCSQCGELKPAELFFVRRSSKDGLNSSCKDCCGVQNSIRAKKYYLKNKDKIKESVKACAIKNTARILDYSRAYYRDHKELFTIYRKENKEKRSAQYKSWFSLNRKKVMEKRKLRVKTDIQYRLQGTLRHRLLMALGRYRQGTKSASAVKDLGMSMPEFIKYIESLWTPGMSWDNYGNKIGSWSLDHIKALSTFDLSCPSQQKQAVYYTNIRPLWHKDNLSKGNRTA
jgi:hypothetical protein